MLDQKSKKSSAPSPPPTVQQTVILASTTSTTAANNTKIIAQTHSPSMLNSNSVATPLVVGNNHLVDSGKATFAISALVNGQTTRGNGIKHLNGPTSKGL